MAVSLNYCRWTGRPSDKRWFDDAANSVVRPDPSQKLRADVFRHGFLV
jgi:hypothetical protein